MKITVDTKIFAKSLDTLLKLAPPTNTFVSFSFDGKRLVAESSSDLSQCSLKIPLEAAAGDAIKFAMPIAAMSDAIKGHATLDISVANASLKIKGKGYEANLATVEATELDEVEQIDVKSWTLEAESLAWLSKAAKQVQLKPTTILSSWVPIGIKVTDKSAFVACYDSQRLCWTASKEAKGDFQCVAPAGTLIAVLDAFQGQTLKVETGKGRLKITSKTAKVTISLPVEDDLPTLEEVMTKVKEAGKMEGKEHTVEKAAVQQFFDNARSVVQKERAEITAGKNGLSIQSNTGKVETKLAAGNFKIDYEFFVEAVSKVASEAVTFKVVEGAFLSIGTAKGSIIVAQNQ
jgi:hypothetical protein